MRSITSLALILVCGVASADRLITIPTGSKIRLNTVRVESLWEQSRSRTQKNYVGFGVTDGIDMEVFTEKYEGKNIRTSFDVSYNYIPPIVGIGPGISFGIKDFLNVSRDGRRMFLAITTKEGYADSVTAQIPAEITIGGYFGSVNAPFIGAMLPFTDRVRFLAEFNGKHLEAGLDIRPLRNLGLRAIFDNKDVLVGAQFTFRY
ncbi:MAG: hypothetical protein BGO01_19205 [Armatimonadetes bacterium 55-13]|nr:hypothetical protein [Armatimonadota bacterium]OJU64248.1 MAG: hypothetical protein BGO01_19205 [Armatimonadetes bacterium 55-13]